MESLGHHQPLLSHTGRLKRIYHLVVGSRYTFLHDALNISIGEAIAWGERCRIKHLPTRMYLAVLKDEDNSLRVCAFTLYM